MSPSPASQSAAELLRLIHNLIRLGTIAEVDHGDPEAQPPRVRVQIGDLVTARLQWIEARAGTTRTWSPPTLGEQVVVFSPGGDLSAAVVLPGLYRNAHPAPVASGDLWHVVMPDGAVLEYDHQAHHLRATLPGSAEITAPAGLVIHADTTINGNLTVNGDSLTHNGKNVGHDHKHSGVSSGTSNTGEPV